MFNPIRVAGPIFEFELLTTSRRGRYYAVRSGYACILLLIIWQIYEYWVVEFGVMMTPSLASRFALSIFAAIAIGQEVLVVLLTPAMVSGVITSEKQRKTLHYLMASCLGNFEIVFGKLFAKMLYIGVFLAVGFPISSLLVLLGGVDPRLVVLATACTACTAFFLCALSVFVSVYSKTTREALFLAYTLEGLWLFVPEILRWIVLPAVHPTIQDWIAPINEWLRLSSPFAAIFSFALWRAGGIDVFLEMMGMQLGAGLLLAVIASWRLRTVFRAQCDAPKRRLSMLLFARGSTPWIARPECGDDPMVWKEWFTSRQTRLMRIVGGLALLAIGIPLAYQGISQFILALEEYWMDPLAKPTWSTQQQRFFFGYFVSSTIPLIFTLGLLGVATRAAASITSEHEGDTWTSLTATVLTPREIVFAKMAGAFKPAVKFLGIMLVIALMGEVVGSIHWVTLPLIMIESVIFMLFAASFGIWISMSLKSTWRAQFLTVGLLFLIGMIGQTALNLSRDFAPPLWPGFYPMEIERSILEPDAIQRFLKADHYWSDLRPDLIGATDLSLIVLGVLSPFFYGGLSVVLTFFAIRGFDRAAGRPRRPRFPKSVLNPSQTDPEVGKSSDLLTSNC